jgi:phosphoribosylformylglycinamidine (FGAM) synthase-like enzyme
MGIPTLNGAVWFDDRYIGNPLVYCGCVGLMKRGNDDALVSGAAEPGDRIIALGGRTGRDGIHGATFSSAELTDTHADEFSHAVQIGNAIEEKRALDAILRARDYTSIESAGDAAPAAVPLFNAITDCGAGGFSSAVGEMGEQLGAEVHLDRAPLKYPGLTHTEIWISEAQERFVLAVPRPIPGSPRGLAVACGMNPRYGDLDPKAMAVAAVDEALRNVVAVGADPSRVAVLDNFCWGVTDLPDRLGSLVLAAEGCRDASLGYRVPFVSGKDSLNNEFRTEDGPIAVPPSLLISSLAIVEDVDRTVSMDLKEIGSALYLVGATRDEMGGSHHHLVCGVEGGVVPQPRPEEGLATFTALHAAIAKGHVRAAHDLSEGGLAVAAAEMAFAGEIGALIDLRLVPVEGVERDTARLFSESSSRFLVEVASESVDAFEAALAGVAFARVGETIAEPVLRIEGEGPILEEPLAKLEASWRDPLTDGGRGAPGRAS